MNSWFCNSLGNKPLWLSGGWRRFANLGGDKTLHREQGSEELKLNNGIRGHGRRRASSIESRPNGLDLNAPRCFFLRERHELALQPDPACNGMWQIIVRSQFAQRLVCSWDLIFIVHMQISALPGVSIRDVRVARLLGLNPLCLTLLSLQLVYLVVQTDRGCDRLVVVIPIPRLRHILPLSDLGIVLVHDVLVCLAEFFQLSLQVGILLDRSFVLIGCLAVPDSWCLAILENRTAIVVLLESYSKLLKLLFSGPVGFLKDSYLDLGLDKLSFSDSKLD
jgi:hypothetical protein